MSKTFVIPADLQAENLYTGESIPVSKDNPLWTFKRSFWCITGALMALNQRASCEPLFEAREAYSDAVECGEKIVTISDDTHATILEGFRAMLGIPEAIRASFRPHMNAMKNAYATREEALKSLSPVEK